MRRAFATVVLTIPRSTAGSVRGRIRSLDGGAGSELRARIEKLGTIHFISMTVVAEPARRDAHLLITITADGDADSAVKALGQAMKTEFADILSAGHVRNARQDPAGVLQRYRQVFDTSLTGTLWLGRMVGLPFDGLPEMTIARIKQEADLADWLLKSTSLNGSATALETLEAARKSVYESGDKRWAFEPMSAPFLESSRSLKPVIILKMLFSGLWPLLWPLLLVPAVTLLLGSPVRYLDRFEFALFATLLVSALSGLLAWNTLRRAELKDLPDDAPPNPARIARILARENQGGLNLLITVSKLKPGRLRRLTIRLVLRAIEQFIKHEGTPGFLGGNGEIGTLHSGRWLILPGTDLLMYVAHYDGSWLSYMQDFIDLLPRAPTAIWSNTEGFPRTRMLFEDGATDGDRATRWFHRQQREIGFRYEAFPKLSLGRIRANAAIRQGLATAQTKAQAEDWLSLFGAPGQKSEAALPRYQSGITTLAYGALGHRHHAACLVLSFAGDAAANRLWLQGIKQRISYGWANRPPPREAGHEQKHPADHVLGLAASGLRKLGMSPGAVKTFPASFVTGMDSPGRAKLLGDAPKTWAWGHGNKAADAVVLIYACSRESLDEAIEALEATAVEKFKPRTVRVIRRIYCAVRVNKGEMTEPFGFRDGLSQPIVPGTPAFERGAPAEQVVAPGEFVLGFADDNESLASVPTVDSGSDHKGLLSTLPSGRADIGHGSSFLVIRQLAQDRDEFIGAVGTLAKLHGMSEEQVAAKIIGRWQNGSSLVRNPRRPGAAPDNDFGYASEDPDGLGCPKGAHIRRSNPRDAIQSTEATADKPLNRRRLLRVGRPYLNDQRDKAVGTLFMCLNADIERQFELVQQAWLLNSDFANLRGETDPLTGHTPLPRGFTIPRAKDLPLQCRLPDFVKMLGGGYFWLPSKPAVEYLVSLRPDDELRSPNTSAFQAT